MGIGSSSQENVNKNIRTVLIDCGFAHDSNEAIGEFETTILQHTSLLTCLIESFEKKINAEGAMGFSTSANIRTMELFFLFWMEKYPTQPIPRDIKQRLQRQEPKLFI